MECERQHKRERETYRNNCVSVRKFFLYIITIHQHNTVAGWALIHKTKLPRKQQQQNDGVKKKRFLFPLFRLLFDVCVSKGNQFDFDELN